MLKPGSRCTGAMIVVTGLCLADARLALAQEQTQEGIQEVVVTAERRAENLQTTPIAITALSAEDLSKAGVNDFAGVAKQSHQHQLHPVPELEQHADPLHARPGRRGRQPDHAGRLGRSLRGWLLHLPSAGGDLRPRRCRSAWKSCAVRRAPCTDATPPAAPSTSSARSPPASWTSRPEPRWRPAQLRARARHAQPAEGRRRTVQQGDAAVQQPRRQRRTTRTATRLQPREPERRRAPSLRWDTGGMFTADYFFEVGQIESTPIYYQDPALRA